MRKLYAIIIVVLMSASSFAQAPNWAWAKSAGSTGNDYGNCITTDAFGNVYAIGTYETPSITFGTFTLTNAGNYDIFIVKYDASGNVIWANSAGSTGYDYVNSIDTDSLGNVYLTGGFSTNSISFGIITINNVGGGDVFIAKYDALGNVLWAKGAGGIYSDLGNSITTDAFGNVYITGCYYSPTITFGSTTLTKVGDWDIFIVKYDSSGNVLWAKGLGSIGKDYGNSITTDVYGNVYVTGYFSSSITFGLTTLSSVGGYDIFIVKYDSLGNLLWAKRAGSSGDDSAQCITIDVSGNVYVTGNYRFGSISFGALTLPNLGFADMFIAKYSATGNLIWARGAGSTIEDSGNSVTTDTSGNVYVAGFSSYTITFGAFTLTNAGMYIVKYTPLGNVLWAVHSSSAGNDRANSITGDSSGDIYVTGYYNTPSISFGTTTLTSAGNRDIFIAKLDSSITTSIYETNIYNEFNLFPNPATSNIIVKTTTPAQLIIQNLLGETMLNTTVQNNSTIEISHFAKGIYIVKAGENVKRLIVE